MALDGNGRPIPVSIPDPPQHSGHPTETDIQFMLMAKKADDALRLAAELSRRVNDLEKRVGDILNAKIAEFGKQFETMMGERLKEVQKQVDAMIASHPYIPPPHHHHDSSQGH
jgi:hypothetical protein